MFFSILLSRHVVEPHTVAFSFVDSKVIAFGDGAVLMAYSIRELILRAWKSMKSKNGIYFQDSLEK